MFNTWTPSANNALSVGTIALLGANVAYRMWRARIDAGWTVEGSASGAAGGMDAVDRLTNAAAFVWAANGVQHSWGVLKSPALQQGTGRLYWAIKCSTGAGNEHLLNISHGSAAFTGGNSTTDPTAPANVRTLTNKQVLNAANANSKWHRTFSDNADVFIAISRDGTGYPAFCSGAFIADALLEASDDFAAFMFECWADSAIGGLTESNIGSSSHGTIFYKDGTVATGGVIFPYVSGGILMNTFTNNISSVTGKTPDYPLALVTTTASKSAFHGQVRDVAIAPYGSGTSIQGKTDPNVAATVNFAVFGCLFIPMPGLTANPSF